MYVNSFIFGIVATLAAMFIIVVLQALFTAIFRPDDDGEPMTEEEYKEFLEDMTGKKFRIIHRNGIMIGEPIDGGSDDNSNEKSD